MRRDTRTRLAAHGVRPRRGLGQSFLVAPGIAGRILDAAAAAAGEQGLGGALAVEIGPGAGALTEALVARAGGLLAIEVDPRLLALLVDRFGRPPHVTWILGDALTYDYPAEVPRLAAGRPALVVANLPYAVATPILLRLLECGPLFRALVVMVQREVADRLVARAGTKAYGPLTLAVQGRAAPRRLFTVPPSAFHPRPAVASAGSRAGTIPGSWPRPWWLWCRTARRPSPPPSGLRSARRCGPPSASAARCSARPWWGRTSDSRRRRRGARWMRPASTAGAGARP